MKRVFAFIGFSFAITLLFVNVIPFSVVKYVALILSILTVISFLIKSIRQAKVVPVILCSCTVACLLFSFVYSNFTVPQLALDNKEASATLSITSVGNENNSGSYTYTAKINQLDSEECDIKVLLYTKKQLDAEPYDNIIGDLKLYSIADNAYSSYGYYADNIYLSASLSDNYTVTKTDSKPLHYHLIILSQAIKTELYNRYEGDVGALAVSILTGDTSRLSDEVYNNFKICGVTHTVAVSGLHTAIISLSVYFVLKLLRCPKVVATPLTLITLFTYIAVADFSKSAIRAGIMVSVMLISKLLSSKADALNSLGIATFILCLNPYAVFDAGAALSVSAVLGILVIYPNIRNSHNDETKLKKYILDTVFLTVSVTLGMMPVMCLYFDFISLVGLIINCVIIPLLEISLICLCLTLIFCKSIVLAFVPSYIADLSLGSMIKITDVFADSFYWMQLSAKDNYLLIASALILIFIGALLIINKTASVKIISLVTAIMILLSSAFSVYDNKTTVTVNCLSSGGIIITSSDTVVGINIDDYRDAKALLNENKRKQCALISCDAYRDTVNEKFYSVIDLDSVNDLPYQLDDKITVSLADEWITITIFDNCFKIYEKDVIINDIMLSGKSLSQLDNDIVLYYRYGREVRYRYG